SPLAPNHWAKMLQNPRWYRDRFVNRPRQRASVSRHAGRGEFKTDARFLAGADGHPLSASNRLAVADDLGLERVRILFVGIENRSGEHARGRRGLRDVVIHAQFGVGGQVDDDGSRRGFSTAGVLLLLLFRRRHLLFLDRRWRGAFVNHAAVAAVSALATGPAVATVP